MSMTKTGMLIRGTNLPMSRDVRLSGPSKALAREDPVCISLVRDAQVCLAKLENRLRLLAEPVSVIGKEHPHEDPTRQ